MGIKSVHFALGSIAFVAVVFVFALVFFRNGDEALLDIDHSTAVEELREGAQPNVSIETEGSSAPPLELADSQSPDFQSSITLFSEPSEFDEDYLKARDEATQLLGRTGEFSILRTEIKKFNESELKRFFEQAQTEVEIFEVPVDLDLFSLEKCRIWSADQVVELRSAPGVFTIATNCVSRTNRTQQALVMVRYDSTENKLGMTVSGAGFGYQLTPLVGGYVLLAEIDQSSIANRRSRE